MGSTLAEGTAGTAQANSTMPDSNSETPTNVPALYRIVRLTSLSAKLVRGKALGVNVQLDAVVGRMYEVLLRPEITLRCLNGCVP